MPLSTLALPLSILLALAGPTTNPAELDEQAFGLIDWKLESSSGFADTPAETGLDAAAAKYLADRKPVVELLRRAASLPSASWAPANGDMQVVLARLNHARHCVNLLILQSRHDLAQDRPDDAVSDLLAASALARHVGDDNLIVDRVVEWGAESAVADQWGRALQRLPKATLAALPGRLAVLPAPSPVAGTFAGEYAFGKQMLAAQKAPGEVNLMFAGARGFYDAVAARASLAPEEYDKLVDAEAAKLPLNTFVRVVAPSFKRIAAGYAVARSKRVMLDAAVGVLLGGPEAPPADPYATPPAPFTVEKTADGFQLTGTAVTAKSGPVALRVGR